MQRCPVLTVGSQKPSLWSGSEGHVTDETQAILLCFESERVITLPLVHSQDVHSGQGRAKLRQKPGAQPRPSSCWSHYLLSRREKAGIWDRTRTWTLELQCRVQTTHVHQHQAQGLPRAAACSVTAFLVTLRTLLLCVPQQERTGVKMVMIQDGPLPTGADKPLRITGDPFKVQVRKGPGYGAFSH